MACSNKRLSKVRHQAVLSLTVQSDVVTVALMRFDTIAVIRLPGGGAYFDKL